MVNKFVATLAIAGAAVISASAAQATQFIGSYSVSAAPAGNGLDIQTQNIASGINLNLAVGVSQTIDLFKIWTGESDVGSGEDTIPQPISVNFSFTAPPPPFGGPVTGSTSGSVDWKIVWLGPFPIPVSEHYGEVSWTDPVLINFGANGDGELLVDLSDEIFNKGTYGLTEGEDHGAIVTATFTLLTEASVDVPEPATLALFGLGLLGLGVTRRRFAR